MSFLCRGSAKNCYAVLWSYGEICVGCGCCSKDKTIRRKARLTYYKEQLNRLRRFTSWGSTKDIIALQERNIKIDKKYYREEIRKLRAK